MARKVKVLGPSINQIAVESEEFADVLQRGLDQIAAESVKTLGQVVVARGLEAAVTLNDLNDIPTLWEEFVNGRLLTLITRIIRSAAQAQARRLSRALGIPVQAPPDQLLFAITSMENAKNRMVNIGNDLWANARTELAAGMEAGESIPKLAARVRAAAGVTMPRARTTARTEVVGSYNYAAMTTVREAGETHGWTITKEWLSDPDERTRPTHEDADGQEVPEADPFMVGGFALDHPGDPLGPPQEVINCRCTLTFDVVDNSDDLAVTSSGSFNNGDRMPTKETTGFDVNWHIEVDKEQAKPFGVLSTSGEVIKRFSVRESAVALLKLLAADSDDDEDVITGCPPDHHKDEDGKCVPDTEDGNDSGEMSGIVNVSGVAVVEGQKTGDGRQFARNSLDWPDPVETSIPLQWQKETSHGGINDVTVNVGWLTSLTREGDNINVNGVFDADSEDGAEAVRFLQKRKRFGVSIVADDPEQAEVEFEFPEGCTEDSEDFDCFMPKTVIFNSGRIRALTLVDVPAFVEAYIELSDPDAPVTASATVTMGAVGVHSTSTSDESWDKTVEEKRLESPMSESTARSMYAWIDSDAIEDGEVTKTSCKFPHHEVNEDGTPGAANLTACSAGIGALNGARSTPDIPREDMQGVYDHLAAHLRDADREPPPPSFALVDALEPLVAASHIIEIPDAPPAEWFNEPSKLPEVGAITVTDEGQIYGLLAPRDVAHRSFRERVTVPTGVDYSRWMNRQTITASGDRITTGPITMDCGHASTHASMGAEQSIDHYDNSCSVVATVRIGEGRHGTWIAGALLPDITPYQVARMLACQLSGDWRPHREEAGRREFCGALLVPVPGFPVAAHASLRMDHGQLVAASAPMHWETTSDVEVPVLALPTLEDNDLPEPKTKPAIETEDESVETVEVKESPAEPEPEKVLQSDAFDDLPSWEELQAQKEAQSILDALAEELGV